jgi:hypothetical protein
VSVTLCVPLCITAHYVESETSLLKSIKYELIFSLKKIYVANLKYYIVQKQINKLKNLHIQEISELYLSRTGAKFIAN